VHLSYWTNLGHQFGEQVLGEALINVANVNGGIFVLLPVACQPRDSM